MVNVHADTYVAMFGINEEGATVAEARKNAHEKLAPFVENVRIYHGRPHTVTTDFIEQNRIYGFDVSGNQANERVYGFEVKETVTVKCSSQPEVDALIETAAGYGIFDLIKVDYVVSDPQGVRAAALQAAANIISHKAADYKKLFGVNLQPAPQIYADKFEFFTPSEEYTSYQAAEGESATPGFDFRNLIVHGARKMRTVYYNALSGKGFDKVINPIVTDPVVQFTLYMKLRYESGADKRHTAPEGR